MAQFTIKTVEQGLRWLLENDHHEVGPHWARGRSRSTGLLEYGEETHRFYRNYHDTMLVPVAMLREFAKHTEPNPRPFDTRMFRPNKKGRKLLKKAASPFAGDLPTMQVQPRRPGLHHTTRQK